MNIIKSKAVQAERRRFMQCAYGIDWRENIYSDLMSFQRFPDAEYILRSWQPTDDPQRFDEACAKRKLLITIVYRAGCYAVQGYRPGCDDPLMQASFFSEDVLSEFPELAGDAS